jgi:putative effector of murein hydrolase
MEQLRMKKNIVKVIGILIIGAIIGSVISELFALILPVGVVKEFFLASIPIGIKDPFSIHLHFIDFSFSLMLRINVVGLIGMAFGYYLLKFTR